MKTQVIFSFFIFNLSQRKKRRIGDSVLKLEREGPERHCGKRDVVCVRIVDIIEKGKCLLPHIEWLVCKEVRQRNGHVLVEGTFVRVSIQMVESHYSVVGVVQVVDHVRNQRNFFWKRDCKNFWD